MREYLTLQEIEDVLYSSLESSTASTVMERMEQEAETCLCHAYEPSECSCGAWDDYEGEGEVDDYQLNLDLEYNADTD